MVLVDDIVEWIVEQVKPAARRHGGRWCHMVSDTSLEELHAFAQRIGLRREWAQRDHYDLTPGMRMKAVRNGAVEVAVNELAQRCIKTSKCRACGFVVESATRPKVCPKCGAGK